MSDPVRVLHVLGGLERGGAETWLVQVLEHFRDGDVRIDVAVLNDSGESTYFAAVRGMARAVYTCPLDSNPFRFASSLRHSFREHGPYDAIHCNVGPISGLVVWIARLQGIPIRIVHSRNSADGRENSPKRSLYRRAMRALTGRNATHLLAVSDVAAQGAFGERLARSERCQTMTGFDFSRFEVSGEVSRSSSQLRASLGLSEGAPVVGLVGSFTPQKNHELAIQVGLVAAQRHPGLRVLFIGDGPRRKEMEDRVRRADAERTFCFLGDRRDVPELMMGVMDVLLLPSLFEGLPRVLVEAQAAGLPCVVSASVTREATTPGSVVHFVGLGESAESWAGRLDEAFDQGRSGERAAGAIRSFRERGLTISANAERLRELYRARITEGAAVREHPSRPNAPRLPNKEQIPDRGP